MDRPRDDDLADAYRVGYERARRSEEPTVRLSLGEELLGAYDEPAPEATTSAPTATPAPAPAPAPEAAPPRPTAPVARQRPPEARRTGLLVGGVAAVVVLLLAAAFGVGRLVGGGSVEDETAPSGSGGAAQGGQPAAYDGPVQAVGITASKASCRSGPSADAAGNPVTYEPARAHDADLSTAWRCPGNGRGERLTLTVPDGTTIAQVGLVPGYAKTDPVTGEDRYAQNNRITRVRWHFDDGSSYVQRMRGNPGDRSMRTLRVPATVTSWVEVEILASASGSRDTVAVSELALAAPAGRP